MSIYTPISPYTTSYTFQNLTSGDLSFTGITSVESDYGTFVSFTDTAPDPANPLSNLGELGFGWTGGYEALISGPSSGSTFTISYNVTDNDPTQAITSIQQLYVVNSLIGPGASLTATEQASTCHTAHRKPPAHRDRNKGVHDAAGSPAVRRFASRFRGWP